MLAVMLPNGLVASVLLFVWMDQYMSAFTTHNDSRGFSSGFLLGFVGHRDIIELNCFSIPAVWLWQDVMFEAKPRE
jgi:hypothetical protein